ncbi:MAG: HTTM domain-containing protein, partial [Balneolaceae bacterium]
MIKRGIISYLQKESDAAPLAVFRIFFGLLMLFSMIRFAANGWIEKLYIDPSFFFSYYGFEWIQPLGNFTWLIFAVCGVSALLVSIGYKYRISIVVFFLSFTYIELMDKTTYLNHYYFISVLSFLMIFLPAHTYYSWDARKNENLRSQKVPAWAVDSIKLLLFIVYFYAGLAKLNSDWLVHAMPLKIWLPSLYSLPLLGDLLQKEWAHYLFSWSGAIYDLTIPFLLLIRRTRLIAFVLVVVFHLLTGLFFPIG